MTEDFGISIDDQVVCRYYFSENFRIEGKKGIIHFDEKFEITKVSQETLKLLYAEFNPSLIYKGNIDDTLAGWKYLLKNKIDLYSASMLLAQDEIIRTNGMKFYPPISSLALLGELAYLVEYLFQKQVTNVEHITPKIRRKIGNKKQGAIKSIEKQLDMGGHPCIAVSSLYEAINSIISELRICKALFDYDYNIIFNEKSEGPDFYLNDRRVKLEVSRKFDRLNIEEYGSWMNKEQNEDGPPFIPFNQTAMIASVSIRLVNKIEEEIKQGEIIVIDISTLFEGFIFIGAKYFSPNPEALELKNAMDSALEITQDGRKAIVLYATSGDSSVAICIEAEWVLNYIEKIKKDCGVLIELRRKAPLEFNKAFSKGMLEVDQKK